MTKYGKYGRVDDVPLMKKNGLGIARVANAVGATEVPTDERSAFGWATVVSLADGRSVMVSRISVLLYGSSGDLLRAWNRSLWSAPDDRQPVVWTMSRFVDRLEAVCDTTVRIYLHDGTAVTATHMGAVLVSRPDEQHDEPRRATRMTAEKKTADWRWTPATLPTARHAATAQDARTINGGLTYTLVVTRAGGAVLVEAHHVWYFASPADVGAARPEYCWDVLCPLPMADDADDTWYFVRDVTRSPAGLEADDIVLTDGSIVRLTATHVSYLAAPVAHEIGADEDRRGR